MLYWPFFPFILDLPAYFVYSVCMKQYTIRKIPEYLDQIAREKSKKTHESLNTILLDALSKGLNADGNVEYHDMDDLVGTWVADPDIDVALASFKEIDEELWN